MKRIVRNRRLSKQEAEENKKIIEQVKEEFPPLDPSLVGKDNYGKPKAKYLAAVAEMDDEKLYEETKHKIWLSAYAANNPHSDYHWHVTAIYAEWDRRKKVDQYARAFNEVSRNA